MTLSQALTIVLHQGAQLLLVPVVAVLILLVLFTVFSIGWVIVEFFTERRHFKANHRAVIAKMRDVPPAEVEGVVRDAPLLRRQADALVNVARNMGLPDDELFALAEVEMERVDTVYARRVNITDTVSKVAPMLGLMGTLIPLGPGIVAMGQGDVSQLSSSLLVAFDTTIAGLVTAVVALVIGRVRKTWYGQYHTMVQALMGCILEEAAIAREAGVRLPYGDHDAHGPEVPAGPAAAPGASVGAGAVVANAGIGSPVGTVGAAVPVGPASVAGPAGLAGTAGFAGSASTVVPTGLVGTAANAGPAAPGAGGGVL